MIKRISQTVSEEARKLMGDKRNVLGSGALFQLIADLQKFALGDN